MIVARGRDRGEKDETNRQDGWIREQCYGLGSDRIKNKDDTGLTREKTSCADETMWREGKTS